MPDFNGFPKMARLSRDVVITEKLDGTNAQILIEPASDAQKAGHLSGPCIAVAGDYAICAGSRNRWVTPQDDNYGFASWVWRNAEELVGLGAGRHFGEWWGSGIQRGYGLKGGDKRFSLFNTARWTGSSDLPACCSVVPVLYSGPFSTAAVDEELEVLEKYGSVAASGFMQPEGVIVYHTAAGIGFKKTIVGDGSPKSLQNNS